jgi:hypothetical protein
MRSNPQSPLATPLPDPENILKKVKVLQGASSCKFSDTYGDLPNSAFHTPVVVSHISHFPIIEMTVKSKLGDFPIEYSSFSLELKELNIENFDFLASPEVVNFFSLESLEYFPLLCSPSPRSFKFFVTK